MAKTTEPVWSNEQFQVFMTPVLDPDGQQAIDEDGHPMEDRYGLWMGELYVGMYRTLERAQADAVVVQPADTEPAGVEPE